MITKAVRAQMHRILDDAIDLNNAGHVSFFRFSGHVEDLDFQQYVGKWKTDKAPAINECFYLDDEEALESSDELANMLEESLKDLEKVKAPS